MTDENGIWIYTIPKIISNSEVIRSEKQVKISPMPMALDPADKGPASAGKPYALTEDRRDKEWATASNDKPLEGSSESHQQPAMPTVESKPDHVESDRPDVAISEWPQKLEEELRIERSARKHLEEELRSVAAAVAAERSAVKHLEEELRSVAAAAAERSSHLEEELRAERSAREALEEELRTERLAREALEERLQAEAEADYTPSELDGDFIRVVDNPIYQPTSSLDTGSPSSPLPVDDQIDDGNPYQFHRHQLYSVKRLFLYLCELLEQM